MESRNLATDNNAREEKQDQNAPLSSSLEFDLGSGYCIKAMSKNGRVEVCVLKDNQKIGSALYITDYVDISCITHIEIDNNHVNFPLYPKVTLGQAIIKFLLKFPQSVRKLEFRFILETPDNLTQVVEQYHFDQGKNTEIEETILLRKNIILPVSAHPEPQGIIFKQPNDEKELNALLSLLQNNAYWQKHLTVDRLKLLVNNSKCVIAYQDNRIVGFARILTDGSSFASLWDVVVEKAYQGKGIGTGLMHKIFSSKDFSAIKNWIIFTDSAKWLYEKFGFVSEKDISDRKLMHKLRLQDEPPVYISELITIAKARDSSFKLNSSQSREFLFGEQGKRNKLSHFWKSLPQQGDILNVTQAENTENVSSLSISANNN